VLVANEPTGATEENAQADAFGENFDFGTLSEKASDRNCTGPFN
jgi:hypothetical protein